MGQTPRRTPTSSDPSLQASVRINVKLVPGTCAPEALRALEGVLKIEPLFPDEEAAELSSIYVIEVRTDAVSDLTQALLKDRSVEFVERPPRRRST